MDPGAEKRIFSECDGIAAPFGFCSKSGKEAGFFGVIKFQRKVDEMLWIK